MHFFKLSALLLATTTSAQSIQVAKAIFDVTGCADAQGVYDCYQKASLQYVQTGQTLCNTTSNRGTCLIAASVEYQQGTLGCMIKGCWNRATTCQFQLALAAYVQDIIVEASFPALPPPFFVESFGSTPGSCVCAFKAAQYLVNLGYAAQCVNQPVDNYSSCYCCAYGERLAGLRTICPNNDLSVLGVPAFIQSATQNAQQQCSFYQQSNWNASAVSQCPKVGVPPIGPDEYLNPLSLPADFPATSTLSNLPGTVTAVSQLGLNSTVVLASWETDKVSTYTLVAYGAAATTATTTAGAPAATGLSIPDNNAGGRSGGSSSPGTSTKSGAAGKYAPPGIIGVLATFLLF